MITSPKDKWWELKVTCWWASLLPSCRKSSSPTPPPKDQTGTVLAVTWVMVPSELENIYSKASMVLHSTGSFQISLIFCFLTDIFPSFLTLNIGIPQGSRQPSVLISHLLSLMISFPLRVLTIM